VDDVLGVPRDTTLFADVLDNDPGGDDPMAVVEIVTPPARGTASVEPDRTIRYDADAGFDGADALVYRLVPSAGLATTAVLTVTTYRTLASGAPAVFLPRTSISAREVGVVVNDMDPQSVAVAAHYVAARAIPAANVVHLSFTPADTLTAAEFQPLYDAVASALGPEVQALVVTWTEPWRVEGMSITSAFALGFDLQWMNPGPPCEETAASPYFASASTRPHADHGVRPAMMLAGETTADAIALVDRGVASDGTFPAGTAYLVRTSDPARSVRWPMMQQAATDWDHVPDGLAVVYRDGSGGGPAQTVESTSDVLLYLTGLATVPNVDTNTYLPGAVADHLTSYGGILTVPSGQMSVLRWLEAGATASFGTVVEPCNYTQKFPDPMVLLDAYYRGATVVEAYWKSVEWPGEGVFVGEPLARPWGRVHLDYDGARTLRISTTSLEPGRTYAVLAADSAAGPFAPVASGITVPHRRLETIVVPNATRIAYRLEAE
jgi:uncharacterized protein (TIGR03790 family)